MRVFTVIVQRIRALLFGARLEHDARHELQEHFDAQVRMHEASGLNAAQARRAAAIDLGGLRQLEEDCRDARGLAWWDNFVADTRYGFRQLRRRPGASFAAILTLALGVGATAAVFGVVDTVVLRPMPFPDSSRLYSLYEVNRRGNIGRTRATPLNFMDWRQQSKSFEDMAGFIGTGFTLMGRGDPEFVIGQVVTTNFLDVLGVKPIAGRTFMPHENVAGSNRVVILTYRLWQRHFGGDPSVVNTVTTINGLPYYVVGILPPWFQFPSDRYQLLTPLVTQGSVSDGPPVNRDSRFLRVIARLKKDVSEQTARAELTAIGQHLADQYPDSDRDVSIGAQTLKSDIVGDSGSSLMLVLGAVGVVLMIACVNVAGLAIARGSARSREFGVRLAIGASRSRLIRQLTTEGLVLFTVGGVSGVALAAWTLQALRSQLPQTMPRVAEISIDWRFLAFGAAMTLLAGIAFSVLPAINLIRRDTAPGITNARGSMSDGRGSQRLRAGLIVGQIAATMVLLACAGLAVRSLLRVGQVDVGFDRSDAMTFSFVMRDQKYPTAAKMHAFADETWTALENNPGVRAAGLTTALPFSDQNVENSFTVDGPPVAPGADPPLAGVRGVAGHYTAALGARLVQGRELRPSDNATSELVVVVTRDFATKYITASSPIGARLKMGGPDSGGPWRTIVGVVDTIHHQALDEAPRPEVWMPFSQVPDGFLTMWARGVYAVTRTSGDPSAAVPVIRTSMRSLDAELPLVAVTSLDDLTRESTSTRRLETSLLAAFAAIALVLAAVGVFGVLAFYVVQHLPEFGVRLALGATPAVLVTQVLRRGLVLMAIGTAIGLPAALALGRTMSTLLFHVAPTDPWAIGAAVAVLTVVTILACTLPARRAMRTDPLLVLRAD